MTQVNVEGYDAILVQGTPRFRLNKKLIARDKVPEAIQAELIAIIQDKNRVRVVEPAPDQAKVEEVKTGEQLPLPLEGIPEATPEAEADVDAGGYTSLELELLEKVALLEEQISTPSEISPGALGSLLLNNFGIYTALAEREPQIGDIHPFTLVPMNRYDTGLAYVARKRAVYSEAELKPAVESVEQANPVPTKNSFPTFAERTGVGFGNESSMTMRMRANDPISDEAYPEPNLRGTTIRPHW